MKLTELDTSFRSWKRAKAFKQNIHQAGLSLDFGRFGLSSTVVNIHDLQLTDRKMAYT